MRTGSTFNLRQSTASFDNSTGPRRRAQAVGTSEVGAGQRGLQQFSAPATVPLLNRAYRLSGPTAALRGRRNSLRRQGSPHPRGEPSSALVFIPFSFFSCRGLNGLRKNRPFPIPIPISFVFLLFSALPRNVSSASKAGWKSLNSRRQQEFAPSSAFEDPYLFHRVTCQNPVRLVAFPSSC